MSHFGQGLYFTAYTFTACIYKSMRFHCEYASLCGWYCNDQVPTYVQILQAHHSCCRFSSPFSLLVVCFETSCAFLNRMLICDLKLTSMKFSDSSSVSRISPLCKYRCKSTSNTGGVPPNFVQVRYSAHKRKQRARPILRYRVYALYKRYCLPLNVTLNIR